MQARCSSESQNKPTVMHGVMTQNKTHQQPLWKLEKLQESNSLKKNSTSRKIYKIRPRTQRYGYEPMILFQNSEHSNYD